MRVGFDLDGVLYNFGDSVRRYLEHTGQGHLWKSGPTPKPFWDFYTDWGWTGKEFVDFCNAGADARFIFTGPTRPNAAWAVQAIKNAGHEIVIITDRQFGCVPDVSHTNTLRWLIQHNIPFDELHFSADKTVAHTDIFIEDKLENYDAITAAGTPCVLVNRAWNDVEDNRFRINDVVEYPAIVEAVAQNSLVVL